MRVFYTMEVFYHDGSIDPTYAYQKYRTKKKIRIEAKRLLKTHKEMIQKIIILKTKEITEFYQQ